MDRSRLAQVIERVLNEMGGELDQSFMGEEPKDPRMLIWEDQILGIEDEPRGPLYTGHGEIYRPKMPPAQRPYMQVDEFGMPNEDLAMVEMGIA
jgi:hypothetical protein